jgi:pimeloyl-ACP methyl ester carboxylesterase
MECQIQGINVYYDVIGQGRPLITLHGFWPDHRLMSGCLEPVFQRRVGWQRIYFDLPGMGRTPGAEWLVNSDQMLDIVWEFIERIIPGQPFVLAGESYGGYLARGLVHRKPDLVQGLLLICPMIVADQEKRTLPPVVVLFQDPVLLASLEPAEREEFNFAVVQGPRVWERTRDEILPALRVADETFLNRLQTGGYPFSFEVDAVSTPFEKPALILLGRQDSSVGYRDAWSIVENYPRATFAVLDRAGHNLQIEQEALFDALVHEWLDRVEESLP